MALSNDHDLPDDKVEISTWMDSIFVTLGASTSAKSEIDTLKMFFIRQEFDTESVMDDVEDENNSNIRDEFKNNEIAVDLSTIVESTQGTLLHSPSGLLN